MSIKSNLNCSLYQLLQHDNGGFYATRYDRRHLLLRFTRELMTLGYKIPTIRSG